MVNLRRTGMALGLGRMINLGGDTVNMGLYFFRSGIESISICLRYVLMSSLLSPFDPTTGALHSKLLPRMCMP